jgi:hypothetical protein
MRMSIGRDDEPFREAAAGAALAQEMHAFARRCFVSRRVAERGEDRAQALGRRLAPLPGPVMIAPNKTRLGGERSSASLIALSPAP